MITLRVSIAAAILASALAASGVALAQKPGGEKTFVTISSDKMEADNKRNVYIFMGNVVAKRNNYTIKTDRLEVFNKKGQEGIDRIVALGNVTIETDGRNATGDRAVYYEDEARLVITGNARAWEGQDVVTGEEMTLYINEDRSVVKGGKSARVKALIHYRQPQKTQSQAGGK